MGLNLLHPDHVNIKLTLEATKTDTLSQKKVREVSDKVCSVWDVNANGWRSFRYDRVQTVKLKDSVND